MLNRDEIKDEINIGSIVIEPFNEKLLNPNSYDVRIGQYIVRQKWSNPWEHVRYNSSDGQRLMWSEPAKILNGFWISPGETILCHTEEFIGGRDYITTEMRAKSTTGRYGLSVCKCAGLGDIGFISRWTMEMTNHSRHTIELKVGEPIAQILFHRTGFLREEFQYKGRYGQGEWSPMDMLPKSK